MKVFLKGAREAINDKDYDKALNIIDTGLADDDLTDPENATAHYTLLVFKALALHHLERDLEAVEWYERASQLNPSLPLAWQGLLSHYEEREAEGGKRVRPLEALLSIYRKTDPKKHRETLDKLLPAYMEARNYAAACKLYLWLLTEGQGYHTALPEYIRCREALDADHVEKEIQKRKFRLGAGSIDQIRAQVESEIIKESDLDTWYRKALDHGLDGGSASVMRSSLAKFLIRKVDFYQDDRDKRAAWDTIKETCEAVWSPELFEVILDHSDSYDSVSLERYGAAPDVKYVAEAKYWCCQADFSAFQKTSLFSMWTFCTRCWDTQDYTEILKALPALKSALQAAAKKFAGSFPEISAGSKRYEFLSYVRLSGYAEAMGLASGFDDFEDGEILAAKLEIYRNLDKHKEEKELLLKGIQREPHSSLYQSDLGWVWFKLGSFDEALKMLSKAEAMTNGSDSTILYRLGRTHWAKCNHERALTYWLRAVKLSQDHAEAFLYLGKYYLEKRDLTRAEKCYTRALKLDSSLVDAAIDLASIWIGACWNSPASAHKMETARNVVGLVEPFTGDNLRNWRLWKYMGIAHLWIGANNKACVALQNALKSEHADELDCLLLLARAYRLDSKMTAACKAYTRALEVKPECELAKIGLATVKLDSGAFEEAIALYKELQGSSRISEGISCLLGKAYSRLAIQMINETKPEDCIEALKEGLGVLKSIALGGHIIGLKALSALCNMTYMFRENKPVYAAFSAVLEGMLISSDDNFSAELKVIGEVALRTSALASLQCLSLIPEEQDAEKADLWLAIAQNAYRSDNLDLTETCLMQALRHNQGHAEAWNLFGLVALEQGRLPLAQHCFVSAIESCGKGSVNPAHVYLNFAMLYLKLGDMDLVQEAIEKAQMNDVELAMNWFAQAQFEGSSEKGFELLGEAVGCEEAGQHVLLNKEYARMAWARLQGPLTDLERRVLMERLHLSLMRVVALDPADSCYANLYGLVQERLRLPTCVDAFPASDKAKGNLFRALVTYGLDDRAKDIQRSPGLFEDILKARRSNDLVVLSAYIVKDQPIDVFEAALWEQFRLSFTDGPDRILEEAASANPESTLLLALKMVTCADADEADALLMQLIEHITGSDMCPSAEVLWLITRFMKHRACHVEALQLQMSIIEAHIHRTGLWEDLGSLLDELRSDDGISSDVKEQVTLVVKQWLDVQVPQLEGKPTLEELEAWYDRLFPPLPVGPTAPVA